MIKRNGNHGGRVLAVRMSFIIFSIVYLFVFFLSSPSSAEKIIYTIQTGSFPDIKTAEVQYESLEQTIDEKQLDYLRIEKVGDFHSVRLGKFEDRVEAEAFLSEIITKVPDAILVAAYFIEERIKKIYKSQTQKSSEGEIKDLPVPAPEKTAPRDVTPLKQDDKKMTSEDLKKEINLISEMVAAQDYEKALEAIKKDIEIQPDNPEINGWHGAILLKMNRPADALSYLQKAAELSPEVADYHNGVGYCFFYLNKFDRAVQEFEKAIALDPSHIDALAGLGVSHAKTGQTEKAMDIYDRLKTLDMKTASKLLKIIEDK